MDFKLLKASISGAAVMLAVSAVAPSHAETSAQFFKGKTIRLVVSAGAGGMYGRYSRIFAKHVVRHIPGNPAMILEHKPGAGGLEAANYLYNVAPKDGTVIAMLRKDVAQTQKLRPTGIRFDAEKFEWIGAMNGAAVGIVSVWHTAPAKTLEEAKAKQVLLGGTGRGGEAYMHPNLMNSLLGTKFKVVTGYRGIADIDKAIEAGEVHGRGGAWLGVKALRPHWITSGHIIVLAQVGLNKSPDLPDIPLLTDIAPTEEGRAIAEFISASSLTGRTISAPPGTVPERVETLRAAMQAVMKDPAFLEEAAANKADINPVSADSVAAATRKMTSASPQLIAKAKLATGLE